MSDFDFINFLAINNTDKGGVNTERRMDLEERRKLISSRTGVEAQTLYEFTQEHPPEPPKTLRNLSIGALIGIGIGLAVGAATGLDLLLPALSFAVTGGAIGAFSDTKNTRRGDTLVKYEHYLDGVETAARSQAPGAAPEIQYRDDHAKNVVITRSGPENAVRL